MHAAPRSYIPCWPFIVRARAALPAGRHDECTRWPVGVGYAILGSWVPLALRAPGRPGVVAEWVATPALGSQRRSSVAPLGPGALGSGRGDCQSAGSAPAELQSQSRSAGRRLTSLTGTACSNKRSKRNKRR